MLSHLVSFFRSRRWQSLALVILALVTALFFYQAFRNAYRPGSNDFGSYLLSAEALSHGLNPYVTQSPFHYMYPIFLAMVLIPFTWLPIWLSHGLWFLRNTGCFIAATFLFLLPFRDKLELPSWRDTVLPFTALVLFHFGVVQDHLFNGQVNFVILFFCALFFHFERLEKSTPAALCLAIAAAIKLTPLIFLGYLLVRQKYAMIALTLLFFALLSILPVIFLGSDFASTNVYYFNNFMQNSVANSWHPGDYYFTTHAFVRRILPFLTDLPLIPQIAMLVTAAGIVCTDWLVSRGRESTSQVWTVHLYLIGILLVGPMSETHHLVVVLPIILIFVMWGCYSQSNARMVMLGLLFYGIFHLLGRGIKGPFYVMSLLVLIWIVVKMVRRIESPPKVRVSG